MANRIFIIPRRNDLEGMNVQVTDLWPNTSLRNGVLDPQGQTCYVGACADSPGLTVVSGTSYVRGSKSTTLAANPVIDDTTGGGNDCYAPVTTTLGLAAYLRERVQKGGAGGSFLTFANANTIAAAIRTVAEAGGSLDLSAINVLLAATGGVGTELTSAGGSTSFGTVVDILRILSGETYISPQYTIITDAAPVFLDEADRDALIAAQTPGANGGTTFVSKGHFMTSLEPGYVGRPTTITTGFLMASANVGQLHAYVQDTAKLLNPAFTYGSGGTAKDIAGNEIPATGVHAFLHLYTVDGGVAV